MQMLSGIVVRPVLPLVIASLCWSVPTISGVTTTIQVVRAEGLQVLLVDTANGDDATADGSVFKPYRTITRALKAASAGATIQLSAGEYSEQTGEQFPLVLKAVNLVGDERSKGEGIKIVGGGRHVSPSFASQNVTVIALKEVSVRGVTITNPNERGYGLWIESVSSVVQNSSFIESRNDGIFITGESGPRIANNYFYKNKSDGLTAAGASKPRIEDNIFEETGFGINITGKAKPTLTGNTVRGNMDGIVIEGKSEPILRKNTIQNNQRSGVVVLGSATPDLGGQAGMGENSFASNGKADLNNVTRPHIEVVAMGNRWAQPIFLGKVTAEPEVMRLAAEFNAAQTKLLANQKPDKAQKTNPKTKKLARAKSTPAAAKPVSTPVKPPQKSTSTPAATPVVTQPATTPQVTSAPVSTSTSVSPLPTTMPPPSPPPVRTAEPVAARASGPYRVLITDSRPEDTAQIEKLEKLVGKVIPQNYAGKPALQVGVFSSQENADRLVKQLGAEGFKAVAVMDGKPLPAQATDSKDKQLTTKPATAEPATPGSEVSLPSAKATEQQAPGPGTDAYRVLVTDNRPDDVNRLKELVNGVVSQTYAGKPALQVGVFASRDNADRMIELLSEKGFRAVSVSLGQG
ncbi:MAG: DUF1565 domain-containing protein [Gemmatimonadaceae bacterium]|nr:DUF1565 domain-containing protein [Gloeobacterales cyanobacterium ES-bin-141]